jgi:magnesium chelatase family protein
MSVARTKTAQPTVPHGTLVTIEADLSKGLHSFTIVGLAGKAVDEAKDRVSAAIKNSGYQSPKQSNQKIVVSLAPADLKKEGPLYDLPIAIAYLTAHGDCTPRSNNIAYIGELGLDGSLRPVRGVLPAVQALQKAGLTEVVVPEENAGEAALVEGITITPAPTLATVIAHIDQNHPQPITLAPAPVTTIANEWTDSTVHLDDVRGQESAKRGLIIAAAGGHNILMVGPPGTGKTMLARAFQTILPPLDTEAVLEVLGIHSIAGEPITPTHITRTPPYRAPHHTASHTSLVGGGAYPRPGEVTLAHRGVLFMDEFPEFERRSLDALRQPLEDRVVTVSRVQSSVQFPADFILMAAMNPYRGSEDGTTDYAAAMADTYKQKVSGPILDRIDLWLEVPHVDYDTLTEKRARHSGEETTAAREQILAARERAAARYQPLKRTIRTNSQLTAREIEQAITITDDVHDLLKTSSQKLNLSPRSYHRLIKVARTIADLDDCEEITPKHVLEALQYRVKV